MDIKEINVIRAALEIFYDAAIEEGSLPNEEEYIHSLLVKYQNMQDDRELVDG